MTYIILVAGQGVKLQPLTLQYPKSLYKLDSDTTVLQRMVRKIRQYDDNAEIVVAVGFMSQSIKKEIDSENVTLVYNPFYSLTKSIASLWFAREYLLRDNVTIINGDVVIGDELYMKEICKKTEFPYVLIDSSVTNPDSYNIQVQGNKICVMSKQLSSFYAKYACITKLDSISSRLLKNELEKMINNEMFNQYYEDVLVQMIFERDFELYYKDIKGSDWIEVDCVDDLLKAKIIQHNN